MVADRTYGAPDGLRAWIEGRGLRHWWVASQLGYSAQYLSRVLNGANPVTQEFRQRCHDLLGVPDEVWTPYDS